MGPATATSLVEELVKQQWRGYPFRLENFPAGRQILQGDANLQARAAAAMVRWLAARGTTFDSNSWKMRQALFALLKQRLPLTEPELLALLDWSIHVRNNQWRGLAQIIKVLGDYLRENELSQRLGSKVEGLVETVQGERASTEVQRQVMRLNELIGRKDIRLPLEAADTWAKTALVDIGEMSDDEQAGWGRLLLHCLQATGSAPSKKWVKDGEALVAAIGDEGFRAALLRWFPLVDKPRPARAGDAGIIPLPTNAELLKGLAWLCSRYDQPEVARALAALALSAYRRVRGQGPRAVKVGNACFWALGNMPGGEGLAQLSILKARIKGTSPQKAIAAATDMAAERGGVSKEDAEELGVPTYGLDRFGRKSYAFGEVVTRIEVIGSNVEQWWEREGQRLAWEPKEVGEAHAEELKEIAQTVKDIRKMVMAQRDRLDSLYLSPRKWPLAVWRERYLEHPIIGTLARRLIWKFSQGDRAESGIWYQGQIVGRDDAPLRWLDDHTNVELWHPISAATPVVLAWRNWLSAHEVQQPFKQAHREIYPLTDAERATGVYSNRFAAHILRQHQFNALCAARGWKNSLRLMVDSALPPATRQLTHWGLRAEFWVEGAGDHHDTNTTGTFLFLATDQVRFYRSDAVQSRSHARGGGYYARRPNARQTAEPLPLESIPELVFSEIMRDVDLFVGVASIGNDPNWLDGGPEVRYRDYWHGYSFGDLTESAKTRRQVLEGLLPRLKIAARCRLTDRFLVVRGDIRTYKIHLGSGNILMEPNDQYLCIVPSRGQAGLERQSLFLPFEGDRTLAVILSKAFMLADDTRIKDETIARQLRL